jgi:hypothetical protein
VDDWQPNQIDEVLVRAIWLTRSGLTADSIEARLVIEGWDRGLAYLAGQAARLHVQHFEPKRRGRKKDRPVP